MKLSIREVFHPAAYGLQGSHFAVIATLPPSLGGNRCVVDIIPASCGKGVSSLLAGFETAVRMMPYEVLPEGSLVIQFLGRDFKNKVHTQCVGHYPANSLLRESAADAYFKHLSFRARVAMWLELRDRVVLSADDQSRLINNEPALHLLPPAPSPVTEERVSLTPRVLSL